MPGVSQQCFDAGMDDYLSKPFSSEQLRAVMERTVCSTRLKQCMTKRGYEASSRTTTSATPELSSPLPGVPAADTPLPQPSDAYLVNPEVLQHGVDASVVSSRSPSRSPGPAIAPRRL